MRFRRLDERKYGNYSRKQLVGISDQFTLCNEESSKIANALLDW